MGMTQNPQVLRTKNTYPPRSTITSQNMRAKGQVQKWSGGKQAGPQQTRNASQSKWYYPITPKRNKNIKSDTPLDTDNSELWKYIQRRPHLHDCEIWKTDTQKGLWVGKVDNDQECIKKERLGSLAHEIETYTNKNLEYVLCFWSGWIVLCFWSRWRAVGLLR